MTNAAPVIDLALVKRLISEQFPAWAALPISAVEPGGWDNRTFRLGPRLSVRLPSAAAYAAQVDKEQRWLPWLAPQLPLPVPEPVARGEPGAGYPWPWSVYRWLPGRPVDVAGVDDMEDLATALAGFLRSLQGIDPAGAPPPGAHNFHRGGPLTVYDGETRQALAALDGRIDVTAARRAWDRARATVWTADPVWLHGDVSAGNLLAMDGRLGAVIDFGCCGVGDPACDLAIAWTLFTGSARQAFRAGLDSDDPTWVRGQGWALWKALITLARTANRADDVAAAAHRIVDRILAEPADAAP